MKKVYLFSLVLLASSAFGTTFQEVILKKTLRSPLPGTKIERKALYPFIVTEHRKDGVLLGILGVETIDQMLAGSLRGEIVEHWVQKKPSSPETPGGGGLIPTIEIPVRFPGPIAGVFGEGGKLDIGGSQSITFGGSKNYTVEAVADPNVKQTWFPDLKMEQHLKVNVKGTIGEKLSVDVEHDSKAQSELSNTIKLTYDGLEDEILQKVEAGDVSLSLPGTQYSSVSGKHKGLFGVKTFSQIGPLAITTIASKEQGEASSEAYKGYGGKVESLEVRDYDYMKRKFYWLGEQEEISSLELFREVTNPQQGESYIEAKTWINPADTLYYADLSYHAHFEQLERGEDYIFNPPNWIELDYPVGEGQALAVYYMTKSGREVGDTSTTPLQLKLIKPDGRQPWHYVDDTTVVVHPTWEYEMKNFYDLGAENIIDTSIAVSIWRKVSGAPDTEIDDSTNIPYLQLLGLDLNGDGRVDEEWIEKNRYLTFPSSMPFFYLPDGTRLPHPDSAIYYETNFNQITNKYYIVIEYQTSQPKISLPRMNIIEESEAVRVDDELWVRGRDYDIDYATGTITLKRVPQAHERISIDYQWAPLISLASKSLLGVRATYQLGEMGELGSTFLFRSVATPTERPKPGEEPTRNMLTEIDGNLKFGADFLTTLADYIPLVDTDHSSELSISGEVAASFPDPNTKGQAYLDDMEGTSINQGFPMNFKAWLYGSVPEGKGVETFANRPIRWYNPEDGVRAGNIHEGLPDEEKERQETVLQLEFEPDDTSSWAGLSTVLSPTRIDLRTYSFLEVWVKGGDLTLKIDLASKLSEDGIRRNRLGELVGHGELDSEDANGDGRLDWDEDTGIDGVEGKDGTGVPGDDGNDDYGYTSGSRDYSRINGTEDNQKLDTESLDGDTILETDNAYFEYTIDLSDTSFLETLTDSGWKFYRVPLDLYESKGVSPDFAGIKYGRIWLTGASKKDTIQIYSMEIVGNRWINEGVSKDDTLSESILNTEKFYVEVVSNVYDISYVSPFDPGVDRYGRPMRESSLKLVYEDMRQGHKGSCYRTIMDPNARNYTNYDEMAFWLKREGGVAEVDFFLRFGGDTLNYYEVRKTLSHSAWEEVRVELKELPLIKHSVYDTTSLRNLEHHVGDYGFRGNPSLTKVEWMSMGVVSSDSTVQEFTGKVYVNELRLASPKRNVGMAGNVKLAMKMADLADVSVKAERKDSEFRKLTETSSAAGKSTTNTYAVSGRLNVHKFGLTPFSIPLTVNMSKTVGLPKYGAGNDVELRPDQRWGERTESKNLGYSLSLSKPNKSQNRLLRLTLDPLKIGFNRSYRVTDTPDSKDSTYSFNSTVSYSLSPVLKPLNLKLFQLSYFPSSIRLSGTYNKSHSLSLNKTDTLTIIKNVKSPRTVDYSLNVDYSPLSALRSSYKFSARRDLERVLLYRDVNIGKEWQRDQSFNVAYDLPIPVLRPDFSYSVAYGETRYLKYAAAGTDSTELLKVSTSSRIGTDVSFNILEVFDKLGWLKSGRNSFLARLKSIISTPSFSYSRDVSSSYLGLLARPSLRYQLGLQDEITDIAREYDPRDQRRTSDSYSVNWGISLWKLSLKGGGDKKESQNVFPSVPTNDTWSSKTTWPRLNLDIDLARLMGPFSGIFNSVSLTSRFSIQNDKSGSPGVTKSTNETYSVSPSIKLSFKKGINTTISYRYTGKTNQKYDLGKQRVEQRGDAVDITINYSFSAPTGINLPIIRRIRFTSNLDATLTGTWGQDRTTQFVPDKDPLDTANSTNFSVRPSLSYRFSSTVSGSFRAWFAQRTDLKRDSTNRDMGIDFSATFRF